LPSTASPSFSSSFRSTAPSPTDIYPLSLHDALPISPGRLNQIEIGDVHALLLGEALRGPCRRADGVIRYGLGRAGHLRLDVRLRSEEHTSELQSRFDLVCRLLLEKKKTKTKTSNMDI